MVYRPRARVLLLLALGLAPPLIASATEIVVNVNTPDVAVAGDGDGLVFASYERGGVTIELTMPGNDFGFGFWDAPPPVDPGYRGDVLPYLEDVGDCGNDDRCTPWLASFSTPVDAAGVHFRGATNESGSSADIVSATFFLQAWSGPNGTGTLLADLTDPGFTLPTPDNTHFYPLTLTAIAPGIRSIVFGADTLTVDPKVQHVNLSWVSGLRLTIVPEPATGTLLGLGVLGIAVFGRDRRRRTSTPFTG